MQRRILILLAAFALTWAGLAALYGETPRPPRIGCKLEQRQVPTGSSTEFVIFADQLPPLTTFTLTLTYEPNALSFSDGDPESDGYNLRAGTAFTQSVMAVNQIDNPTRGQIRLAVTQPVSSTMDGDMDTLAAGTILALNQTVAPFRFTETVLYDHNSRLINRAAYGVEECFVEIGNSGSPTPTATPTTLLSPLLTPTPVPPGLGPGRGPGPPDPIPPGHAHLYDNALHSADAVPHGHAHFHALAHGHAHGNFHTGADAHRHRHAHPHDSNLHDAGERGRQQSVPAAHPRGHRHGNSHPVGYAYGYTRPHRNAHGDAHGNPYAGSNPHRYADARAHRDRHPPAHAYRAPHGHTHLPGQPDAGRVAGICRSIRSA